LNAPAKDIPVGTVMAIGWIPYVSWWRHLPSHGFPEYIRKHDRVGFKKLALRGMLRTGNQQPPISIFGSWDAFMAHLSTKEYRGAICITDIVVDRSRPGDPRVKFGKCLGLERVGYTGAPVNPAWRWLRKGGMYWKGEEGPGTEEEPTQGYDPAKNILVYSQRVEFRVAGWMRDMSKYPFKVPMPFAWMEVQLTVNLNNESADIVVKQGLDASLSHSSVPSNFLSHTPPRGEFVVISAHDMLNIGPESIRTFFESPDEMPPQHQYVAGLNM